MSKSLALKRNQSSMQVLKTLLLLLQDNYTMSELVEQLNLNEKEPIFNNSVVSKYINTCRFCGIEILKIHNKYYVTKLPFGLNLTNKEKDLITLLQNNAKKCLSNKTRSIFENLICRLSRFSSKELIRVDKNALELTYSTFESAVKNNKKIRLMFRTKAIMDCTPLEIVEHKGKPCFKVLLKDRQRFIVIERVTGLEILGDTIEVDHSDRSVVFKIYNDLIMRYSARQEELVTTECYPEYITATNRGENKDVLLSRLLRYDSNCEIIHPKDYRNEMKAIIDETLANYGE
ncbi:MAG: WYL domain-containing protein [Cyanobacteria bacterium SIG28]|nr:WYL domain-containing protein [Cyanobacteria bacterium SIG28]